MHLVTLKPNDSEITFGDNCIFLFNFCIFLPPKVQIKHANVKDYNNLWPSRKNVIDFKIHCTICVLLIQLYYNTFTQVLISRFSTVILLIAPLAFSSQLIAKVSRPTLNHCLVRMIRLISDQLRSVSV